MSVQDEFAAFIRGLQPRIKNQVGPLVEDDDLATAMRLAARVELWSQDTAGGSGSGGQKEQGLRGGSSGKRGQGPARGNVQLVDSVAVMGGQQPKKGKGQQAGGQ